MNSQLYLFVVLSNQMRIKVIRLQTNSRTAQVNVKQSKWAVQLIIASWTWGWLARAEAIRRWMLPVTRTFVKYLMFRKSFCAQLKIRSAVVPLAIAIVSLKSLFGNSIFAFSVRAPVADENDLTLIECTFRKTPERHSKRWRPHLLFHLKASERYHCPKYRFHPSARDDKEFRGKNRNDCI